MSMLRYLLPGLVAAVALVGCGETKTITEKPVQDDICARLQIDCHDPTGNISCDPADGLCKCGGEFGNGIACGEGEKCVLNPDVTPVSPTCVSERCEGVACGRYEACDPRDGLCKCDGVQCGTGFTCVDGTCVDGDPCDGVTCREGESCDAADRICKCGNSTCSVGESCRTGVDGESYCVGRRCVGMNCPDGTECSPVDGLCHCGNTSGPACTAGQACLVDEESGNGSCAGQDICEGVVCHGGTTCSPLDGQCRCGGFDNAAPICGLDQTCDQANRRCIGGDTCANVTCLPGSNLSCDDEEGICKCGGHGGVVCEPEQGCVAGLVVPMCVKRCNPLTPNVEMDVCGQVAGGAFKGCYYSPADSIAFCTNAGGSSDGQECTLVTDCAAGHHCVPTADGGVCRRYCDTAAPAGDSKACYNTGTTCVQLSGADAVVPRLGVCLTVTP